MWIKIARLILRNRILLLAIVGMATVFMAWQAQSVRISYKFYRILPIYDSTNIVYENFQQNFGDISNTVVIAVSDSNFFTVNGLQQWDDLAKSFEAISGVQNVIRITNAFAFAYTDSLKKFVAKPLLAALPTTQNEVVAFKSQLNNLPFYKNLLFDATGSTQLMLVQLDPKTLYDINIIRIVEAIKAEIAAQSETNNTHYFASGLPYIRMANVKKVEAEVYLFILLTLVVTAVILLLFLKSIRATLISLVVVVIGVVFSFGLIALFDFEITLLSSLIPPLVIVIGIPNCIFLINKYHSEYKIHGNKAKSLQRVIRKIGNVTLLTNITTSLGFAAFTLTSSVSLVEFGAVAATNILVVFFLSLIIIPISYSYLQAPKKRHYKHLDHKWLQGIIGFITNTVKHHRGKLYATTIAAILVAAWGIQKITTTGNLSDDFSKKDDIYKDLKFIESQFNGVVPLEIVIDTRRAKGAFSQPTLSAINRLQAALDTVEGISKSLAITDLAKFLKQGFFEGNPEFYQLPTNRERSWILSALNQEAGGGYLNSMMDSTGQMARVTLQVADRTAPEMAIIHNTVQQLVAEIFDAEIYSTQITGASVVFLKGTYYLIKNLILSLLLAILVISILMAFLFGSVRMVLISVLPNLIPLLLTAGLMGYLGIPLKPSTILVFSIAFGISVDDTIHFLAKYRQELKENGWKIGLAVMAAIKETGVSMIYTSIVLLFGFSIFIASEFGGTVALGILVSITLFFAMATNLLVLPSLLLSLEKLITQKTFSETITEDLSNED